MFSLFLYVIRTNTVNQILVYIDASNVVEPVRFWSNPAPGSGSDSDSWLRLQALAPGIGSRLWLLALAPGSGSRLWLLALALGGLAPGLGSGFWLLQ